MPWPPDPTLQWAKDFMRFYRPLGFFVEEWPHLPDEAAEELFARWVAEYGPKVKMDHVHWDPWFLLYDKQRVFFADVECDALPGNTAYVDYTRGLARISQGNFLPQDIREDWNEDVNPPTVLVTLRLGDERHEVELEGRGDYINSGLIEWVDRIVRSTTGRFWNWDLPGEQCHWIVFMGDDYAERIFEARSLKLERVTMGASRHHDRERGA